MQKHVSFGNAIALSDWPMAARVTGMIAVHFYTAVHTFIKTYGPRNFIASDVVGSMDGKNCFPVF